ncbi:hypothetical protein AF335_14610 [Streptomyces eurocidicus]|uniref:Uncharacterized protein n=1 Tax=Streptomyces eurocidicus TaxID=66423 RepID=A0A2N8NVH4_STREU|nr:hypothetical protein AF335_14610 [Streptomyces eurocidicus]
MTGSADTENAEPLTSGIAVGGGQGIAEHSADVFMACGNEHGASARAVSLGGPGCSRRPA